MNDQHTISRILAETKTIAVVGLSSSTARAGYYVPAYMQSQGYRIIPVNPHLEQALGEQAYPDLGSVPQSIDLVLAFRRSQHMPALTQDAIAVGARALWMQLGIAHEQAAAQARAAGLHVVQDACIMIEHRSWAAQRRASV